MIVARYVLVVGVEWQHELCGITLGHGGVGGESAALFVYHEVLYFGAADFDFLRFQH